MKKENEKENKKGSSTATISMHSERVEYVKFKFMSYINRRGFDNDIACCAMRELMDELGHGPETELEAVLAIMQPKRREGFISLIKNLITTKE